MSSLIVNQDAFLFIKQLKNDGIMVDHIITDPPYNISKNNNLHTMNGKRQGVDFGDWDYTFDLTGWIHSYCEILNEGGSVIIFNSYLNISYIATALMEAGLEIKDLIKWVKTNPMPRNIERRYVQDTEYAIWAVKPSKKKKWVFNKPKSDSYLRADFRTPTVSGKEKNGHPTQKSLSLMKDLICIHTNKKDLIIDPFMGSASTGEACLQSDRIFIGSELSRDYFELAKKRLSKYEDSMLYDYKEWIND